MIELAFGFCSRCGRHLTMPARNGITGFCPRCGHMVISDHGVLRDANKQELQNPDNQEAIKLIQKEQQDYCHEKGWWG